MVFFFSRFGIFFAKRYSAKCANYVRQSKHRCLRIYNDVMETREQCISFTVGPHCREVKRVCLHCDRSTSKGARVALQKMVAADLQHSGLRGETLEFHKNWEKLTARVEIINIIGYKI